MKVREILVVVIGVVVLSWQSQSAKAGSDVERSLRYLQSLDQRVADVSWNLEEANLDLCPRKRGSIGIAVHDIGQYAPEYRVAAKEAFSFYEGYPAILSITEDSPAWNADLRVNDTLISINGHDLRVSEVNPKEMDYSSIEAVQQRLERLPTGKISRLRVYRDGEEMAFSIAPKPICGYRVEIVPGDKLNAYSDGNLIQLIGRLVVWTRTDDELALLIGHEIAHNILSHSDRITAEKINRGLLGSFGESGAKLRDMEREADRYSVLLAARAGYDYKIAGEFMRRLSMTSGLGAIWATSHPTARNRSRNVEEAIKAVDRLMSSGKVLGLSKVVLGQKLDTKETDDRYTLLPHGGAADSGGH